MEKPNQSVAKQVQAQIKKLIVGKDGGGGGGGGGGSSSSGSIAPKFKSGIDVPPAKKLRKYPPKVKVDNSVTTEQLEAYLPCFCKMYRDNCDSSWRLNAYGKRFSAAWNLYGFEGAALKLVELAWKRALRLRFEEACPFADFAL